MAGIDKGRVKPQLVRAWFDTVLNPVIRGLRTEADLLASGNFTWRLHTKRFVSLVPVREHIVTDAWDNLDQFLSVYPDIAQLMVRHDNKLETLSSSVSEFFAILTGHPAFIRALREHHIEGAGTAPEPIAEYLAEYAINSIAHLPGYYSAAQLWNTKGGEFLELRNRPGLREHWEPVQTAQTDLRGAVARLDAALTSARNDLSFELDVPIVASVAN